MRLLLAATCLALGCSNEAPSTAEPDLGRIEATLDDVSRTVWPGLTRSDGTRYLRRINGFFDDESTGYWFFGFASRVTADVFLFCREGDTACPLDSKGVMDPTRMVGRPIFSRIPGESGYSPFWLAWTVTVPRDYVANDVKSVFGVEQAGRSGRFRVEPTLFDHGGAIGPDQVIVHCQLMLQATELEHNGEDLVGPPGRKSRPMAMREGWHKQYQVSFVDFSETDGVFAPDPTSESRPIMPTSDINVLFRDCENGSDTPVCHATGSFQGAVSERSIEQDLTGDGDKGDTNNIIMAFPGKAPRNPKDFAYSPLWRVMVALVRPEHDQDFTVMDTSGDQDVSDVRSVQTLREYVDKGWIRPLEPLSEEKSGNPIPGNNGKVFFDCPSQVALEP